MPAGSLAMYTGIAAPGCELFRRPADKPHQGTARASISVSAPCQKFPGFLTVSEPSTAGAGPRVSSRSLPESPPSPRVLLRGILSKPPDIGGPSGRARSAPELRGHITQACREFPPQSAVEEDGVPCLHGTGREMETQDKTGPELWAPAEASRVLL